MTLTPRQRETLIFIDTYRRASGVSPTLREIGSDACVSRVSVFEHVGELVRKRAVTRDERKSRSIELTPAGKRAISNPVADLLKKFLDTYLIEDAHRAELTEILELAGK